MGGVKTIQGRATKRAVNNRLRAINSDLFDLGVKINEVDRDNTWVTMGVELLNETGSDNVIVSGCGYAPMNGTFCADQNNGFGMAWVRGAVQSLAFGTFFDPSNTPRWFISGAEGVIYVNPSQDERPPKAGWVAVAPEFEPAPVLEYSPTLLTGVGIPSANAICDVYLTDDPDGIGLTDETPTGGMVVDNTGDGASEFASIVDSKYLRVQADQQGRVNLKITHVLSEHQTYYLAVILLDGRVQVSPGFTFNNND